MQAKYHSAIFEIKIAETSKAALKIKVVEKIEFRNSRSESYINKAWNTVLSKPIGRTKTVVKYKNGVFLYSRYNDVSDGNIED